MPFTGATGGWDGPFVADGQSSPALVFNFAVVGAGYFETMGYDCAAVGRSTGLRVLDPIAYAASLLVIVTSCVAAASVPALRAARVDPIATLRND